MSKPSSADNRLDFILPDPQAHAPITLRWFEAEYGRETLLLMGNADHEIGLPSLKSERDTLSEFLELKSKRQQLTWMVSWGNSIIGVAWIELVKNHSVNPPSIHLMIGDKEFRGKGIGKAIMLALIQFTQENLDATYIYSRHLRSNVTVSNMNDSLGFEHDGEPYTDANGLEWQNVKMQILF